MLSLRVTLALVALSALCLSVEAVPMTLLGSNSCTVAGGKCLDSNVKKCSTGFKVGLCPGATNIKCCPAAAAAQVDDTPDLPAVIDNQNSVCANAGGVCMDYRGNSCPTTFRAGMCPGGYEVKCCLSGLKFDTLQRCYPQGEAEAVKKDIGGRVHADWITNTCAIRMSQTLNCAGKFVPYTEGQSVTGKTGWNYIFRVKQLSPFIKTAFGQGVTLKATSGRGVDKTPIVGRKGIIYYDTTGVWTDATGHFDLWDGASMVENSHNNVETVNRYFKSSIAVTFWEFP